MATKLQKQSVGEGVLRSTVPIQVKVSCFRMTKNNALINLYASSLMSGKP